MIYIASDIVVQQRLLLLLLVIVLICLFVSLFRTDRTDETTLKKKRTYYAWKGPKTDERINKMFAECIELMKELGVPISESICPEVKLSGTRCALERCCRKEGFEYEFYIDISGHTLGNTEKSLRNTLIHELLHTVPGGYNHKVEWKKWAKYVSEKTGYNIQRCSGDETEEDIARFRGRL